MPHNKTNIFENSKFGDQFRFKGNNCIFIEKMDDLYKLIVDKKDSTEEITAHPDGYVCKDVYVKTIKDERKDQFIQELINITKDKPKYIRTGQAIFNYIDEKYGIARHIQHIKHIDCFYNDCKINDFINEAFELIYEHENTKKGE